MDPRRILLIQLRRIGDVLFTLPMAGVLRQAFPRARIDFLVEKPSDQLVRLDPRVDEAVVYDPARPLAMLREVRARRYDWVLDFHSNGRTLLLTLCSGAPLRAGFSGPFTRRLAYNRCIAPVGPQYIVDQKLGLLKALGVPGGSWSWDLRVPAPDPETGARAVGIAPASRRQTRRWPSERFAELTRELTRAGRDVVFLWGPGEEGLVADIVRQAGATGPGRVTVPPRTSLPELAALIRGCGLVVAVENGPKNLAVALGVPAIILVGPNNPVSFNPHDDPRYAVVRDESLPCIGCESNDCPRSLECMRDIAVSRVLGEIERLLARGAPAPAGPRIP